MSLDQQETSQTGQMASHLLGLLRELCDRIYELAVSCKPSLVVFANRSCPLDYENLQDPETTAQVASQYSAFYAGSFATFSGHTISYTIYNQGSDVSSQVAVSVALQQSPFYYDEVMNTNQPATSHTGQLASQTDPKPFSIIFWSH